MSVVVVVVVLGRECLKEKNMFRFCALCFFSFSVYFILFIYLFFGLAFAFSTQVPRNVVMCSVTYPEMNMSRNVFVVVTVAQVEPTSTSRNVCGNEKLRYVFILGHVTLSNCSCKLCWNKIER